MSKKYPEPKRFYPNNPEKYVGDVNNIISRSSWETKLFRYCDNNPSVIQWNSEDIVIPYFSQADGKMRRYHIDVYAAVRLTTGKVQEYIIEVKPYCQTQKPVKRGRKKQSTYLNECYTWQVNRDKWDHARAWARKNNMIFKIMTEYHLGLKKWTGDKKP